MILLFVNNIVYYIYSPTLFIIFNYFYFITSILLMILYKSMSSQLSPFQFLAVQLQNVRQVQKELKTSTRTIQ